MRNRNAIRRKTWTVGSVGFIVCFDGTLSRLQNPFVRSGRHCPKGLGHLPELHFTSTALHSLARIFHPGCRPSSPFKPLSQLSRNGRIVAGCKLQTITSTNGQPLNELLAKNSSLSVTDSPPTDG